MYESKTDSDLINLYFSGDENALKFLINRHIKAVHDFVLHFTGAKDDTDDIVQETFLKAWKNLKKFRKDGNFKTWLFAIARNTAIDFLRKKKYSVFSSFETESGNGLTDTLEDPAPLSEELFALAEDKETLGCSLAGLAPTHRETMLLRYQSDFTFDEIGKILGKPLNTVKSQHRRALIALRKILEDEKEKQK